MLRRSLCTFTGDLMAYRHRPPSWGQPSEGPLYECLRIFLHAGAVSDDQLVEVPRKQLFERSPREPSIREGQPDVEPNAAMRRCNALQSEQSIAKGPTLHYRMNLDQIIQDDRARRFVEENDFFDQGTAFEGKLVKVVRPALSRLVPQDTG